VSGRLSLLPARGEPKLGRAPRVHDPRDLRLSSYLRHSRLPGHVDWGVRVRKFPLLLNDRIGDCTVAAALHLVQVWCANAGRRFEPTDELALSLYEKISGYDPHHPDVDRGAADRHVLKWWATSGISGHDVAGYVAVDPKDHRQVKAAIAWFGGVFVGIGMPLTAKNQHVHWVKRTGAQAQPRSWGGHTLIYTGYDDRGVKTVTWGARGTATWGFHDAYCEDVWALVSPDWMTTAGVSPSGLDLAALRRDVDALRAARLPNQPART
jgi:hypothetical protein